MHRTPGTRRSVLLPLFALALACSDPDSNDSSEGPAGVVIPPPPDPGSVTFSEPSRTFEGELELTLSSAGTEIRYTTDGSVPTATSTVYDGAPLRFGSTVQVRAQAFTNGAPSGTSSTALYVARTFDASSDLPLVVLDGYTRGKPEDKTRFVDVAFFSFDPSGGNAALSQLPTVATRAGWHLRGQSSASFPQAPYRIELWNEANEDQDYMVAGLPGEADWALIGPYVDRTFIRNALVYDLGREMGLQAPRYAFVEAYINTDDPALTPEHYEGVYMLTETIKNAKNRLNLEQLKEDNTALPQISGGYIFKFDWAAIDQDATLLQCSGSQPIGGGGLGGGFGGGGFGGGGMTGTCWADLEVVDPLPINTAQSAWITEYLQTFHDALHSTPIGNYADHIDVRSFVDHFILNELSRNMDANVRSLYFHKERDEKLVAGPLWDYNLTFLVGGSFGNLDAEGWQFQQRLGSNDWYHVLAADPAFMAQVASRWQELRRTLLSEAQLDARIDALTAPLVNAAARDFERWPVNEVRQSFFTFPEGDTWQAQVQAMRDWIPRRLAWLDGAVTQPIPPE